MTLLFQGEWTAESTCASLDPTEADAIFFPGPGGKPTKAKILCNSCPVQSECLQSAIKTRVEGFWAGTTTRDRTKMAEQFGIAQVSLNDLLDNIIPQPKTKRRRYLHVIKTEGYTDEYLQTLEGPVTEAS